MVYRETPRIAAKDGRLDGVIDDADARPRLRRFDFVRAESQLDLPRVLLASGTLRGRRGPDRLPGNADPALHDSLAPSATSISSQVPRYPPSETSRPPGSAAAPRLSCGQVRSHARKRKSSQSWTLRRERIDRDFKLFPWVDRRQYASSIPPRASRSIFVYKQPVATITVPPGQSVILDRNGIILPREDIDTKKLGPLIRIDCRQGPGSAALGQSAGPDLEIVRPWRRGPTAGTLRPGSCTSSLGSSRNLIEPGRPPQTRHSACWLSSPPMIAGICSFRTAEKVMVLWGEAPESETSGNLEREGKMGNPEKMGDDAVPSNSAPAAITGGFPPRSSFR